MGINNESNEVRIKIFSFVIETNEGNEQWYSKVTSE